MFMYVYSYCYVCPVLYIMFHCVVLYILCVCVQMCTVQLPPGVNPIAVNKSIEISKYEYHFCLNEFKCQ